MRRVFALFCLLFCQSGCGAPAMPTSDRVEISVEAPVKAKVSEMAEMPGQAEQKNGCPFLKSNGECLSCDSPESFEVALEEDCARLCPGRNVLSLGQGAYTTYYCAPKTVQSPFEMNINETDETEFVPASDRGNMPGKTFSAWNGSYYDCSVSSPIRVDSKYNDDSFTPFPCEERIVLKQGGGNPYSVLKCPEDRPLPDEKGFCHSCDEEGPVGVSFNEEKCRRFCDGKRYALRGACLLCPDDISGLKDVLSCRSCGGMWEEGKCREKRVPGHIGIRLCRDNQDCGNGEFCYLNECHFIPKEEGGFACLTEAGGDAFSAFLMCQAMGMSVPYEKEVFENAELLKKLCGQEEFSTYVSDNLNTEVKDALPFWGAFVSSDEYIIPSFFMGTIGNEETRLTCIRRQKEDEK